MSAAKLRQRPHAERIDNRSYADMGKAQELHERMYLRRTVFLLDNRRANDGKNNA